MPNYLEQAAASLNAAAEMVPISSVVSAATEMDSVTARIHEAGGQLAQDLAARAVAIKAEMETLTGHLQEFQGMVSAAAQRVIQAGI